MPPDFIVAGGGLGGAVLASLLARGGKRVLVIERDARPRALVRPEVLWPATMDVLSSLVPAEKLKEAVLPMRGVKCHDGERTFALITADLLREAGVQPWFTEPGQTRERLLASGSFELQRGVEVSAVLKEGERVVGVRTRDVVSGAEREVRAAWTVGDDGAQSMVRQACGIEMPPRMFPVDFLCFGFDWPRRLPQSTARVWLNRGRFGSGIFALLAMPTSEGKGAGLAVVRPWIFDDIAPAREAWRRLCAVDPVIDEMLGTRQFPGDLVRVRRPWGHAPRYGIPGAVLMGDAAHPVSPAGGQGANMSVADACALAEIALAGTPDLVAAYEAIRRPANERSVSPTRWAARLWGLPDALLPMSVLYWALRGTARYPALARHFVRSASTAFLARR